MRSRSRREDTGYRPVEPCWVVPYPVPLESDLGRCDKLTRKARESPGSLRFEEACRLARCLGFEQVRRTRGSHRVFKRTGVRALINLQDRDGAAVEYQVKQIIALADRLTADDQ